MQSLERNGYTADEVRAALHAGVRKPTFKYELLTSANAHKAWLTGVLAARVQNNALADIKRTARFSIQDGLDSIDYLSDRVKPYVCIEMPDGGMAEFAQGVFLLSSPKRRALVRHAGASDLDSAERAGFKVSPSSVGGLHGLGVTDGDDGAGASDAVVLRDIEAYDQLVVLRDDKVADRYTVAAATNYITEVKTLLNGSGIMAVNLTATSKSLPTAQDWPPGTSKLKIINELLTAINYRSLWFDEDGRAVAQPYVAPSLAAVEYEYATDAESVTFPRAEETLDLFSVPNKWVMVVSEPDRAPLTAAYTNTAATSPTSTTSRGRTIVDFREGEQAVDQATLDERVARLAFEASQVYASVDFDTAIMPMHSEADVIQLEYTDLEISDRFSEQSWEMELRAGGRMRHHVRKVVSV